MVESKFRLIVFSTLGD